MDEGTTVCTHSGILSSRKNSEVLSFVAPRMEREDVVLSKVSQAQRDRQPLLSLLCADRNAGPPAAESGTMVTRGWGLRGRAGVVDQQVLNYG